MAKKQDDRFFVRRNEQIRIPKILLVKDGQKLGIFVTSEALRMARNEGLDLVEVSPNSKPPVCSILDYGRYKFDLQKKRKEQQKHQGPKEKEVSFRYVIDIHDLETKVNQIKRILEEGDKVRIVVVFKARENAHKDQGMIAINKCLGMLNQEEVSVEKPPTWEGNRITCRLAQKEKK